MQIKKLIINDHKCLKDFDIRFQIIDGGSSTILIGENGTGKTTMLDTILEIIMSFDSPSVETRIRYDYELEYLFGGETISIVANNRIYRIRINGEQICAGSMGTVRRQLSRRGHSLFPQRIISFYSGYNDKLAIRFKRVNSDYRRLCEKKICEYRNAIAHGERYEGDFPKRKYNRCTEALTPVYLVSILAGEDSYEKEYLRTHCGLGRIHSIMMALDLDRLNLLFQNDVSSMFEAYFDILLEFLDDRFVEVFHRGFLNHRNGKAYYELGNIGELGIDTISIYNFFEKLQTLMSAEYYVKIMVGEKEVNCNDLSEGQRQLIKVLGMLGISKSEDCLVVMDEPDAHMNPRWKYDLKPMIDGCLREANNTQALIATHDPLVINGVDKEYIRIFALDDSREDGIYVSKVIEPTEDTAGMGIDGILQSQYYGLKTSYDKKTSDMYSERQLLYIKLINNEITEEEKHRLRELTRELGALPVSYNTIDFLYDDFIKEYRRSPLYSKPYLSFEEIEERRNDIKRIIEELYRE